MGAGGSLNKKPRSPYHRHCEAKLKRAKSMRCIDGQMSDFYTLCAEGKIEEVRQSLERSDRPFIDDLVKLECNGNTALHIATENGHAEIVELLLEHRCSRTTMNRNGKIPSEEATTPRMQKLFLRSETSDRFHDSVATKSIASFYLPKDDITEEINKVSLEFFEGFETEDDVYRYSLNHQTTAMWLRLFTWFSRTFPSLFQAENLNLDSFHLHKNNDFKDFLKKKLGHNYEKTLEEFDQAHQKNSIEPLLRIYSSETRFYKLLNHQLADSPHEPDTSPHLCDRFIIEFHIRDDELKKRAYIGLAYRGATMKSDELALYEIALAHQPRGVIAFKAFTSTSEDKDIALEFIFDRPPENDQTGVLFVIETKVKSPTVMGIADISEYKHEKEILFMPGNLFIVKKINRDVVIYSKRQQRLTIAEVHLEYLHVPVSFWGKLRHTYRSAINSVT
ncbi:hypothetical protein I4U23_004182 [Adineta vaga]|nr:hypothetical protein I4U23_004182 [Adineta vaga]